MTPLGLEDHAAPRFTRVFLVVLVLGLIATAAVAVAVDPTHTFGTGRVPSVLTGERDTKPAAFRALERPARAVVLGSSRVMKLRPACIEELTGLPAFNFGISSALVEDIAATYWYTRAHSRAPVREFIIGLDVEAFDNHAVPDQRLRSAAELRDYVAAGGLSFAAATRALFGWQGLRFAALSLWYQVSPGARPPTKISYAPDGFVTYDMVEAQIRAGTFSRDRSYADMARKLKEVRPTKDYTELAASRTAQLREILETAHADGAVVDAFIPPILPVVEPVGDRGRFAARRLELDALLVELERQGLVRYFRTTRVEDFGGDPMGYFDGAHMTEANSSRLLLALFHRSHGCGL